MCATVDIFQTGDMAAFCKQKLLYGQSDPSLPQTYLAVCSVDAQVNEMCLCLY